MKLGADWVIGGGKWEQVSSHFMGYMYETLENQEKYF